MSQEMEIPDKAALATVLNYLRNKKLKDTEEALRKELSLLGQPEFSDLSAPSMEVSSLGSSGTEPSKYEESYSGLSSTAPSTVTTTDVQSATTETHLSQSEASSSKQDDSNHLDSSNTTMEVSSNNSLPNLVEVIPRPGHLVFPSVSNPTQTVINIASTPQSPPADTVSSPILNNGHILPSSKLHRSNSELSNGSTQSPQVLTPSAQFAMGSPLLYQVGNAGSALARPILTPILTVLPSVNPITATALQAGGQPIMFSTAQQPPQARSEATFSQPRIRSSSDTSASLLSSPVEPKGSPCAASPPRTLASLMMSEMTPQYLELKAFAEEFKAKRIRLGYTQGAVGQSLAQKGYNNFAQSTISRFEQLQLSPANAAAIKQVLEKWLQDAECPDSQSSTSVSSSTSVVPLMNCRKRKKRAVFTAQTRTTLDEFFKQNPRPNRQLIESIANDLNLLPEEVRVWFCNKRQKFKQSQSSYPSHDRESSVSTSSYIDSPPSFFERTHSPSPKTPFTIEELSKSSASMTTSPCLSTSPVQLSTFGLMRPLSSTGLYPMVFGVGQPPSPPKLIHHSPAVAQTRA